MAKIMKIIVLLLGIIVLNACSDNDDGPTSKSLSLDIEGLENLGNEFVYEGWIIVNGSAVTTGRFVVDNDGKLSQSKFSINKDMLENATTFVLTIEPKNGDDAGPSNVHILGGDFSGNMGDLTISHAAALGSDFSNATGSYILATPTNGPDSEENSGIWFLDISSGTPEAGLNLPVLPAGWKYEGWIVSGGQPVTSGKFISTTGIDEFDGFSGTLSGPPFPGEDYLINEPAGLSFPLNLAGGKAVISIEPDPDNSESPFLLKPLLMDIPSTAVDHVTYPLSQNLNFPTGTVSR